MNGTCRICGKDSSGEKFSDWVKDTFTNHDILHPGEIICQDCLFWFDQRSAELARLTGKDKAQKMQNYSHFIINGKWEPVSKGNKKRMAALLLQFPFPEMAAIAISGQKHIAFRARRNPMGQRCGWAQFEETAVWVESDYLRELLNFIEELYSEFGKSEIESGQYSTSRILKFGIERWKALETAAAAVRGKPIFLLALFLAQRKDDDGGQSGNGSDAAEIDLAGDTA